MVPVATPLWAAERGYVKVDASSLVITTAALGVLNPTSFAPAMTTFCPVDRPCDAAVTNAVVLEFLYAGPPVALNGPLKSPNWNVAVAGTWVIVTVVLKVPLLEPEIVTEFPTLKPCATVVVTVAGLLLPRARAQVGRA